MNRVYKVIWSKAKHCYVVTSEIARSVTKSASSARSAGRKGAAVLAMAALLFTAGGVLGEAATANVTDVSGSSEARNLIIVTKDDGTSTNFAINNVGKAQEADHAKEADYATAATKATSDGNGHVIENTYVKNVDARVGADGTCVKAAYTVGQNLSALDEQVKNYTVTVLEVGEKVDKNFTDLYAKVQTNADAVTAEETARKQADQNNLKVGDDGVISKVTGNDGTTSSAVNKLVLNVNGNNPITMDDKGIKVGKNSTTMDEKGFYAGSDYDYGNAKAALDATEGKIKGAGGKFTVEADGKVTAASGKIGTVEITSAGAVSGVTDLTVNGTFDSKTLSSTVVPDINYTTITGGKTQSMNWKMDAVTGETKSSASTFDENGSNAWAKDDDSIGKSSMTADKISQSLSDTGDHPKNEASRVLSQNTDSKYEIADSVVDENGNNNVSTQTASESSSVVSGKDGKNSYNSYITQNMKKILQKIEDGDGNVLTSTEQTETGIKSTATDGENNASTNLSNEGFNTFASDGTNKTYTKQTATDIKNTAEKGMISHTAKNLVNTASENMTNTVDKDLTTTVGGNETRTVKGTLTETVTGNVTEDYKADLSTKVGGNETHAVTGNQTVTVSKDRTVNVKGTETENFNAQVTNVKTDQQTSVGGNQTNIVTGNQQNTVSGSKTETVKGAVTEKYSSQATTVDGDQSTNVGGNQTHVVTGNQTVTVSKDRTVNVKGTETENFNAQVTNVKTNQQTSVGGKQTNIVGGDQQNTVSGSKTETVNKAVTEKYGSQATTVNGDQSTNVGGNQSNVVKGNQTNTISGSKTESVKGAVSETYGSQNTKVNGDQSTTVTGKQTNSITGDQVNTIGGKQTTTVTGDSSLSAKNITNTASEKITNQIGNGSAVKSEMTANGITNTAKEGTIYNKSKDILNEASGDIINWADGEIGNVATKITNITGDNTVTSDTNGTTFENKAHNTAVKEGTVTKTTISGNTIETGQATMDYADVTKDLSVGGNATVENDLTVKGASEFVGRADFRYDVYVDNNLTVAKETRTDTLYVDHDGYVGGNLNVDGNIETHDAVLSADSRQVVTGRQLYQTNERVDRLDNRIKKVGANAAALAALRPGDFNPDDKFSIAAGFGSYRNANAAALGLFYRPNENVLLSLGTSFGDGENMVNAGVSVKFGRGKSMAERRKEMADEVSSMRDEMRSQDERIAELEEMLKKQSELIEKLSKES